MGCDGTRRKEGCRRNVGRVAGPGDDGDEVVVEVCCSVAVAGMPCEVLFPSRG